METAPTSQKPPFKTPFPYRQKLALLTNDYVYGHSTGGDKAQVEAAGGRIMDNLFVPQNTRDFTSYLLKVQQLKPDVVATAMGGDDKKALREQSQLA